MTLLKDLIEIPESVGRGDYVFTLENAVESPDQVLGDYVVTDQLQESFDDALDQIQAAMETKESRANYLHGSFGSGKSHFMAVLYLLLSHVAEARAVPELQKVVAEHDPWLEDKKFVLVPVHMINSGAETLEEAILSAYVERIHNLHPEAPTPPVFVSGPIFDNARKLRESMGDDGFFQALNEGAAEDPDLGDLGTARWDSDSFDQAVEGRPGEPAHDELISAIVTTLLESYADVAKGNQYLPLEEGLNAMSRHAQELGYDGAVLFLDELILWLATRIADMQFVQREGQKMAALREAPLAERPLPIVSFVARQRDLRDLIGEHYPGAEQLGFHDALSYSEGRFHTIELEDRNLRAIAEKRVLKPKNEKAKQQLDKAFKETLKSDETVLSVLLGKDATREDFRAVYPFSPAFIDILVAASSALQRERTAIRVMVQLLSERRDELEVGDLIPVGDLFGVLSGSAEPFSQGLKEQFQDAQKLYETRLRPQVLARGGLDPDATKLTGAASAEDKLLKTLLLAALIPDALPLRGLTVSQAVALNHGTIATPIPGQETSTALAALKSIRGNVGQLRIQEGVSDPTVQFVLSDIDTDRIIDSAKGEHDNTGARRRLVRDLIGEALGLGDQSLFTSYRLDWRGIDREIEIAMSNVRELPPDRAMASGEQWKLIIDFPFDEQGAGRKDDQAQIEKLRKEMSEGSRTVFWLPAFVTHEVQHELGLLVTIDALLAGERLNTHAAHLSATDREKARVILESQQTQLRSTLNDALQQAYGISPAKEDVVEGKESAIFETLEPTLTVQAPVGSDFKGALDSVCDQLLRHQFPAHPEFGERITPGKLRDTWDLARRAAEKKDHRLDELEAKDRKLLKSIAEPLDLGEMHEGPFILGRDWNDHFRKAAARDKVTTITTEELRVWIEEPDRRGLTRELQDLVILTYAATDNRGFSLHGEPRSPQGPGSLEDGLHLVEVDLPDPETWEAAKSRAAALFGINVPPLASAQNLDRYGSEIVQQAKEHEGPVEALLPTLEGTLVPALGLEGGTTRVDVAREAKSLVTNLAEASPSEAIGLLATEEMKHQPEDVARTLTHAGQVASAVQGANWKLIAATIERAEDGDEKALAVIAPLREAAAASEIVTRLDEALTAAEGAATAIVVEAPPVAEGAVVHRGISVGKATKLLSEIEDSEAVSVDLTINETPNSQKS